MTVVDTHHEEMIHDSQLDYYGRQLATCSSDRSIKIFDVVGDQMNMVADLRGHEGPVWRVAWAHPKFGNVLASCSYDKKVVIWKEGANNQWVKIKEYTEHKSSVNSIAWAPHQFGLQLACASSDSAVTVIAHRVDNTWETIKTEPAIAHPIGVNSVSWAPAVSAGGLVGQDAAPAVKRIVTGGCDNKVKSGGMTMPSAAS